jgi:hypothetical protein
MHCQWAKLAIPLTKLPNALSMGEAAKCSAPILLSAAAKIRKVDRHPIAPLLAHCCKWIGAHSVIQQDIQAAVVEMLEPDSYPGKVLYQQLWRLCVFRGDCHSVCFLLHYEGWRGGVCVRAAFR